MKTHCSACGKETPNGEHCPEDQLVRDLTKLVIKWQHTGREISSMRQDVRNLLKEGERK